MRWIDLGCPIDLDRDPGERGKGWFFGDQRPTLTMSYPVAGANAELSRILVSMHDYGSGLDPESFTVSADFELDGVSPGENLACKFKAKSAGVWDLTLKSPINELKRGVLTVAVKDRQGNVSRIERTIAVGAVK